MFFDKKVNIRIRKKDFATIARIVRKDNLTYGSESHFIRCAVLKLIREENDRLKIGKFVVIRRTGKTIRLEDVKKG